MEGRWWLALIAEDKGAASRAGSTEVPLPDPLDSCLLLGHSLVPLTSLHGKQPEPRSSGPGLGYSGQGHLPWPLLQRGSARELQPHQSLIRAHDLALC